MKTQTPAKLETPNIIKIDLKMLRPNPWQPPARLIVPEDECKKWGEDILKNGLRQIPVGRGKDGVYEVADGWQRKNWFEWLVRNGHPEYGSLPVNLQELTDEQMAEYPEITDESKKKMTVIDRAWSWKKQLADFPKTTQKEFAETRGVTQSVIANTIRLLELPESIQQDIIFQKISVTHGTTLLSLKEAKDMIEFADNVKNFSWSVANLDQNIKTYLASRKPKLIDEAEPIQSTIDTFIPPGDGELSIKQMDECASCNKNRENGGDCHIFNVASREYPCPDNPKYIIKEETETQEDEQETTTPDCCVDCGNQDHCDHSYAVQGADNTYSCENRKPIMKGAKTEAPAEKKTPAAAKATAKTPPAPPKPPAKTTAAAKPAVSAKPKWQRKLVLEEKKDVVMVTYGKAGTMPKFENINASLDSLFGAPSIESGTLVAFMKKVEAEWEKEGK